MGGQGLVLEEGLRGYPCVGGNEEVGPARLHAMARVEEEAHRIGGHGQVTAEPHHRVLHRGEVGVHEEPHLEAKLRKRLAHVGGVVGGVFQPPELAVVAIANDQGETRPTRLGGRLGREDEDAE